MSAPFTPVPDLAAAEAFLAAGSRVLERRRFAHRFGGGPAGPVRDAAMAYLNDDGGFGHALEPDSRTAASQPLATWTGLSLLHEVDAWDGAVVPGACDWLQRMAPTEGGAAFVTQGIDDAPHAPWMAADPDGAASTICTGLLAAVLHSGGAAHRWLDRADELMWRRVATLADAERHAYEYRAVLAFLGAVPDRAAARPAIDEVTALVASRGVVEADPDAEGEVHGPLDFSPRPGSPARGLFDDDLIAAHLDRLAAAQREDGGWDFDWLRWSPAAAAEWRGAVTVENLLTLEAYGRL